RATDMLLSGRKALVIGYGDVGKGSAQSLRQEGMIVKISEVDPICAMQACLDGFEVVAPYNDGINTGRDEDVNKELLGTTDLICTTTRTPTSATPPCSRRSSPAPWSATSATSTTKSTPPSCARPGSGKR